MKKLISLGILIFLIASSCQEIDDESTTIQEGDPISLDSTQPTEFSIFEIVTLDLGEGTFADGQQEGTTLDGVKIPLIIQDNTLIFMVPKLNQGDYKLIFKENNKPVNISFKVNPHDLKESPETMLANYKQESEEQLAALERSMELLEGVSKEELEKDIHSLKSYVEQQFSKAAALSPSDLADMAFFLQANEAVWRNLSNTLVGLQNSFPDARISNSSIFNVEENTENTVRQIVIAIGANKLGALLSAGLGVVIGGKFGGPRGAAIGAGIGLVLFIKYHEQIMLFIIDKFEKAVKLVEGEDINLNFKANYIFKNGETSELMVTRTYRSFYKEDLNSNIPFLKEFGEKYNLLFGVWKTIKDESPIELTYQPIDLSKIEGFTTELLQVHSNHLSISGITNDKVTGSATKENGKLLLTFNTAETDAQEFDFNLIYSHAAFGQLEKTLDAAVVNEGCSLTLELRDKNKVTATATGYGPFTFIYPAGQKEADKTTEILASTFGEMVVKIKDQSGCESEAKIDIPCTLKIDVLNTDNTYTIEALDGLPPFSYTWSNGATAKTQTLPPGTHVVTVSDALGCKIEHTIVEGPEYGTFTDPRDGNVYKTVKIGNQVWFAENLRYAGNIPQVASQQAWAAIWNSGNPTGQPAWAYYNNDPSYNDTYGKLYNWYSVRTGTLCPPGWHIPTDAEWTTLTNYLGGPFAAAGKMKSVTGWDAPNTGATNESGFTGLPGGNRGPYGAFNALGSRGFWWSSSPNGSSTAWSRDLEGAGLNIALTHYNWTLGLSCRCLRD
ncbi:hypothetical protein Aoki45_12310 [Algoriphagus sp. oki45]|uniref:FISUMP domain-containing protein n=1 Tax=Algoriphagus sp. oki45 TaxID=3067294 RepID=UPI0027F65EDE|nr:hypothetical protein Aoki45_12310 [Algoriphagus sp. oki45]